MTDKQIIYNCPHISLTDWGTYACKLYNPRDKNCLVKGGNCVSNISCPYKQFKAKEQECEELKDLADHNGRVCNERLDKIDKLEHDINELNGQLDRLNAENKELKRELMQYEKDVKDLNYYAIKLKQTLTEIKEIAEKIADECQLEPYGACALEAKEQILQKISECEVK